VARLANVIGRAARQDTGSGAESSMDLYLGLKAAICTFLSSAVSGLACQTVCGVNGGNN
jgi:hypothetical protein